VSVVLLVVAALTALGTNRVVRSRQMRKHPETVSMTRAQRYRFGWSAQRYSARAWALMAVFFSAFAVLEIVVLAIRSHGVDRVIGVVGAVVFVAAAVVSFVQCGRRHADRRS
jgi:hypothetical protein